MNKKIASLINNLLTLFTKNNFIGLAIFFSFPLLSQTLPDEMKTDWSKAGNQNTAIPVFDTINILDHGLMADGSTSNNLALENLMTTRVGSPTVFYFPPGNYYFNQTIELNNNQVIKGASSDETVFTFDLNGENHLISAKGEVISLVKNITTDLPKGANTITVENTAGLQTGDFIRIQFDDIHLVTSSWAEKSTGQILKIMAIQGNLITTSSLIRRAVSLSENPYIEKLNPIQYAGIECLHIKRQDATMAQTSNIYFRFTANCWVKGVSSLNANFAHVDIENGAHNHVTGCYFKDAFAYGGGGQGYGVVLEYNTSDCLIDNNIFNHLRHAILLQAGANGNVISYNYSINPYWDEVGLPDDATGDLVLHGNYPYLNLFEGNIMQNIVIDDSHGINGPGNVFLRNRAELYGIFMSNGTPSNDQAFIGNEITSTVFLLGFYNLAGAGHFEYGNNVKGSIIPAGTNAGFYSTLYLENELPDYFKEYNYEVAAIGLPNNINSGKNPAYQRNLEGELTICERKEVVIDHVNNIDADLFFEIFPNPANDYLNIKTDLMLNNFSLKITDLNGKLILKEDKAGGVVNLANFQNGLYILALENENNRFFKKINVVK